MQFHHLTTKQKLTYYSTDVLDDLQQIKIPLFLLTCFIIVVEFVQALVIPPGATTFTTAASTILGIPFILACLCYYFSVIRPFKSEIYSLTSLRYFVLFFGVILFAGGIFASNLVADKAIGITIVPDSDRYITSLLDKKMGLWMIILADLTIPVWYLKLLIPLALWVSMIVQWYDAGMDYAGVMWTKFIFAFAYMGYMFGLRAYMQWNRSMKGLNKDTWCEIQRTLLDVMPEAVGIIDHDNHMVFSNEKMIALCNKNLKELTQKVTEVRRMTPLYSTYYRRDSDLEKIKLNIGDETKQTFINDDGKKLETTNINFTSNNLSEILMETVNMFNENNASPTEYALLSGKYNVDPQTVHSCDIRISHIRDTKMTIIILTDTGYKNKITALEEANLYKDRLLATVSHDLRAPINGTLTFIENTIDHDDVPLSVKQQYLIPAQRSGQFLIHLVNDILDFCQINVQKLRLNFESLSISDTLQNCHQLLEVQAKQKKISFPLELDEDLPLTFTTDHNRLSQIIINLLTNALKFTARGEVKLAAVVIDQYTIEVRVTDTGVGIREEDQKKLFSEFTRIDNDEPLLNPKGIGLGLMIANKLAKMVGPRNEAGIMVESTFGMGSKFSFMIKENSSAKERDLKEEVKLKSRSSFYSSLEQQAKLKSRFEIQMRRSFSNQRTGEIMSLMDFNTMANIPPITPFNVRNPNGRGSGQYEARFRALIVDDDAFNVLALESVLKKFGLVTDLAYNGEEAVNKFGGMESQGLTERSQKDERQKSQRNASGDRYDIIFMDCEMPIMNGIESTIILNRMMKSGGRKSVPVIGCTGHKDYDSMEKCFEAGMADVITKPVSREKLKECLKFYLDIEL